ncbi:TonB-dependent receptor [Duganella qianjiadongensis]|uniref:TonB-dependent receptor n=1 Tax=Duganella qianjiadongensis TaxID=2692176 RepID=A0ABW9VSX1_9BURK|nr:TonB-dependent receptor [Duganella qianjiadongensis]MYM42181.1 TonB-dependent receptor [Duganella qianjiadongensis]
MPASAHNVQSEVYIANLAETKSEIEPIPVAVTVTARRRIEKEQDVPTPTTTTYGDQLKANLITQVQDLQQAMPSLNSAYLHARVSSLAIRGIGSNPANEGLEGSVGLYVDNVYQGRPGMLAVDWVDLEQVDLLRGPQGTLFGKNTTAGVLNFTTKNPNFKPEHSIEASAGQRGYFQTLASLSGPLNEQWAGRISLSRTYDRGWLENKHDGKSYDSVGRQGGRGKLLFKQGENFNLRLSADYNHEDDSQGTLIPYGFGPSAPGFANAQAAATAALGLPTGSQPLNNDPSNYKVNFDGGQRTRVYQGGLSAETNWRPTSGYSLTSILASRYWIFHPHNDNDLTTASGVGDIGFNVKHSQFSYELRLASPLGNKLDYVVGSLILHQNIQSDFFVKFGNKADLLVLNNAVGLNLIDNTNGISRGKSTTDSRAIFGQGDWHLNPLWSLTLGLRATWESKDARTQRDALEGGKALTDYPAALQQTVFATRSAAGGAYDSGTLHVSRVAPSGLATLSYKATPTLLAYSTLSHGEKSGGINISGVGAAPTVGANSLIIAPEKADNFELGIKSSLFNNRLDISSNYFQTRINGYQTNAYVLGPVTPVLILTNAGGAKSEGVELEVKARPQSSLSLYFNGSYNNARYSSFNNAPIAAELVAVRVTKADLTGHPLVGAPSWTINTGGRYEWKNGDTVRQYAMANVAFRSWADGYLDGSKFARIPAYALLNISTGWLVQRAGKQWNISVWVKNALDKHYFLAAAAGQTIGGGEYVASAGTPRTLGITTHLDY